MKAVIIFFVLLIILLDWSLCAIDDPYKGENDDEKVRSGLPEEDEDE